MPQFEPTLPTLRTLALLSLRDADVLLGFAERLYGAQSTIEARWALRRIDTYRRLLGLPQSISGIERLAARSIQRGETGCRATVIAIGTARHGVVRQSNQAKLRLVG